MNNRQKIILRLAIVVVILALVLSLSSLKSLSRLGWPVILLAGFVIAAVLAFEIYGMVYAREIHNWLWKKEISFFQILVQILICSVIVFLIVFWIWDKFFN